MSERLSAKLQRVTGTARKGQQKTALEFTAIVTDTAPADGGIGNAGLPTAIRELFLSTAKARDLMRASLADLEAKPFAIYESREDEDALVEEDSVMLEAVRLRRDEKAMQEGRGIITYVDFRVSLRSDEARRLHGKVGQWLWLRLKS